MTAPDTLAQLAASIDGAIRTTTEERIALMQRDAIRAVERHCRRGVPNVVVGAIKATILTMRAEVLEEVRVELVTRAADRLVEAQEAAPQ